MFTSVIIVSHNTKQLLLDCLASLDAGNVQRSYEIIVVDNASTDGTVQAASALFPQVAFIQNPNNRGFGAANNQGAKVACGETLFFLNSDTLASPQAIQILISAMESNTELGAVAPRLFGADGKEQEAASFLMTPDTEVSASAKRHARKLLGNALASESDIAGLGYLSGAALMVRDQAFEALDGFDESIFFYYEDADLCKRIAETGWQLKLIPNADLTHLGGASTALIRTGAAIELMRSRVQYIRKHFGKKAAIMVGSARFSEHLRKALLGLLAWALTLNRNARIRQRAALHSSVCLWFILGMPSCKSVVYRRMFHDWQSKKL